LELIKSFTV